MGPWQQCQSGRQVRNEAEDEDRNCHHRRLRHRQSGAVKHLRARHQGKPGNRGSEALGLQPLAPDERRKLVLAMVEIAQQAAKQGRPTK